MKQVAAPQQSKRHFLMLDSQHLVPSSWCDSLLDVPPVFLLPTRSSIRERIVDGSIHSRNLLLGRRDMLPTLNNVSLVVHRRFKRATDLFKPSAVFIPF